jgi:hypothetical protein
MNLRKGIFRIFLIIAGLWFIVFTAFAKIEGTWDLMLIAVGVPTVVFFL